MTDLLTRFTHGMADVPPAPLAVAVSGGADSFALLHLALLWAGGHCARILALTVDHGLRDNSAAEAAQVAAWCAAYGIAHETLPWLGDKPTTGLQQAARDARRQLLCTACHGHGIIHLLLGHQADDQAETVMMRLQRGTGLPGLQAMQTVMCDAATGVTLVRPLLDTRHAELREYCHAHRLPFVDDPSNANTEFERVRVRRLLRDMPDMAMGAVKTASRLHRANDTLDTLGRAWCDDHKIVLPDGSIWLTVAWRDTLLPEIQLRVLYVTITALRRQRLSVTKLEKLALRLNDASFTGMTIAGCWIRPKTLRKQSGFLFAIEPPRRAASLFKR